MSGGEWASPTIASVGSGAGHTWGIAVERGVSIPGLLSIQFLPRSPRSLFSAPEDHQVGKVPFCSLPNGVGYTEEGLVTRREKGAGLFWSRQQVCPLHSWQLRDGNRFPSGRHLSPAPPCKAIRKDQPRFHPSPKYRLRLHAASLSSGQFHFIYPTAVQHSLQTRHLQTAIHLILRTIPIQWVHFLSLFHGKRNRRRAV